RRASWLGLAEQRTAGSSPSAVQVHWVTSLRERPCRAACFKARTFSLRAEVAASMALADAPDFVAFSISDTSAEPTTAASAKPPRTETCAGSEIPKPTAIGSRVTARARRRSAGRSSGSASFAPVTPVREMRYRKPDESAGQDQELLQALCPILVPAQRLVESSGRRQAGR